MTLRNKNKSGILFDIFFVTISFWNMFLFFRNPAESGSNFNLLISLIVGLQILSGEIVPKNHTPEILRQLDAKANNITFIFVSIAVTITAFVHYVLTNGITHTFYPEIWQVLLLVTLLSTMTKFIAKIILILTSK